VQPSAFALPAEAAAPVVMVAAGTGLAPFRGFLQERRLRLEAGAELGRAVLFFGCTRSEVDFICEEDLAAHLRDGSLSELVTAFSREDPQRKVYVQHRLAERAADVRELLRGSGHLYVCGGTAMGRDVRRAVVDALCSPGGEREEAEAFVAQLERERRYVAELWA